MKKATNWEKNFTSHIADKNLIPEYIINYLNSKIEDKTTLF